MSGHRKKKHHEEEHENHERWLVSYADFITLLFAFFVVMYSVSKVDNKKLAQAAEGIRWALHMSGTGGSGAMPIFDGTPSEGGCKVNPGSGARLTEQAKAIEQVRQRIERKVMPYAMTRAGPATVIVRVEEGRKLVVRLASAEFFDTGQAVIRPQVLPALDALAMALQGARPPDAGRGAHRRQQGRGRPVPGKLEPLGDARGERGRLPGGLPTAYRPATCRRSASREPGR